MSTRANVEVRVLPFPSGVPLGDPVGAFVILRFNDRARTVVYVETFTGNLYLEKSATVRRYAGAYEEMQLASLDVTASRVLLRQVAKEYLR